MPKHTGLGKGLDALIPSSGFQQEQDSQGQGEPQPRNMGGILSVPVEQIIPNPRQPRSHFEPAALEELAASIREHGIIQPLLVSRDDQGTSYTLIAGERRLQAAQLAGLTEVPVIVRQTSDQQKLELALIENIQRADLNALEEAHAYRQLTDEFRFRTSRSPSASAKAAWPSPTPCACSNCPTQSSRPSSMGASAKATRAPCWR
jgi:ParB family chromosome partitioning protein